MAASATSLTVSAVIPTYDRGAFLGEAIASALGQTYPVLEVVVVDDGSPMPHEAMREGIDPRVRYLRLPTNQGANAARNAGIAAARGDVVAMLDDDDVWLPTKLARQVPTLVDGYEACLCGWQYEDERRPRLRDMTVVTEADLREGNRFCGSSGLVARRQALLEEPFDPAIPRSQEWDVYVRLSKRHPLRYVPEVLYSQRRGAYASITVAGLEASPAELLRRAAATRKHCDWLGEWHYRRLLARNLLINLARRRNKVRYLTHAVRHAGLVPTLGALVDSAIWARRQRRR